MVKNASVLFGGRILASDSSHQSVQ